jgi:two-component system sensor histidine kinase QseC
MRNLVDNTQKYGGASAQVFITITPSGFVFIDTGIGASPQTHQRLGERFYRPAGQAAVGSGLGWSIIERICEIHHAHISSFEVAPHGFGVHFKIV